MHSSELYCCIGGLPCTGGICIPALAWQCISRDQTWQSTGWEGLCRLRPVQMQHTYLQRPLPSKQLAASICDESWAMKRNVFAVFFNELMLRHEHVYVDFYENFSGRCHTARVFCVLFARSVISIKHGTSTPISFRRVLFVLLTYLSVHTLMDAAKQHDVEDDHNQWWTLRSMVICCR